MEEQHSFDEFFRESLADYRETPPPAAWDMVAARLDDDDRKRRGFFFWPWTVLSLLLLVGGAVWLYGWSTNRSFPASGKQAQLQAPSSDPVAATHTPLKDNSGITEGTASLKSGSEAAGRASARTTGVQLPVDRSDRHEAEPTHRTAIQRSNSSQGQAAVRGVRGGSGNERRAGNSGSAVNPASTPGNALHAGSASATVRARRIAQATGSKESVSGRQALQGNADATAISGRTAIAGAVETSRTGSATGRPGVSENAVRQDAMHPLGAVPAALPKNHVLAAITPTQGPDKLQLAVRSKTPDPSGIFAETGVTARHADAVTTTSNERRPADLLIPEPVPKPVVAPVKAPDQLQMLAALEPVMHLFAGAPLPPMFTLYETGLLEPERYFEPIAPAPVVVAAAAPAPDPAAPAMYPPDSNAKAARKPMSLMAFVGYERGIKTPPRNMFTVGLSLLWQLNEKISVGIQPALLYGNMPRTTLTTDKTYQRSAVDIMRFTTRDYSPSILGQIDTVNNYVIREAFDSIIVRGTYVKGSLYHLELPLILQFNPFGAAFRMYGGPSMYFGGSMRIHSEGATQTYTIDRKDSIVQSEKMTEDQIKNYFGKSSLPSYSGYDPNAHSFERLDPVRFGYQFGVGYQKNRLNFDLSVRQQLSGYHQLSSELRQLYALPVFRLSFGYSLIPLKPAAPKTIAP